MGLKKTIIKNLFTGWLGQFALIFSAIIVTPILINHFGKYEYGMWVTIGQGALIFSLFDFGVANSVSRIVAKNLALKKYDEISKIYSTAIAIFIFASLLVLFLTIIVLPFVPDVFKINDSHRTIAHWLFGLTCLNIFIILPLRVGRGLLQAKDRYDLIFLYKALITLLRLIFVILIFGRGIGHLILLAIITLGLNLLLEILLFRIAVKKYEVLKFKISLANKQHFKELISLGASSMVQTFSGTMFDKAQIIFIGLILGVSATPLFAVPYLIIISVGSFVNRLGGTFTPISSRLHATNNKSQLRRLNILGVRYGLALSIPISVFILLYGKELINLWLGQDALADNDINIIVLVLNIFLIPFALGWPQGASRTMLRGTGKHWLAANGQFISSFIGLMVSIFIMLYTNWGVLGAAIGWSLKTFLLNILIFPIAICRHLKIPGWDYFKTAYLLPILSIFPLLLIGKIMERFIPITNIYSCGFVTLGFFAMGGLGIFFMIIVPEDRSYLFQLLPQRLTQAMNIASKSQ